MAAKVKNSKPTLVYLTDRKSDKDSYPKLAKLV